MGIMSAHIGATIVSQRGSKMLRFISIVLILLLMLMATGLVLLSETPIGVIMGVGGFITALALTILTMRD